MGECERGWREEEGRSRETENEAMLRVKTERGRLL